MADLIGQILRTPVGGRRKRQAIKGIIKQFSYYSKDYKAGCGIYSIEECDSILNAFLWRETNKDRFWNRLYDSQIEAGIF